MFDQFRFRNFEPDSGLFNYANRVLGQLMDLVPHDSSASALLTKKDGEYSARVEIVSAVKGFLAEVREADPVKAVQELEKSVRRKIADWHKLRFSDVFERSWPGFGRPNVTALKGGK